MEYRLPQGRNLLEQLNLEGGGTRTATRPEYVEGVVVGDGGSEATIESHCLLFLVPGGTYFHLEPSHAVHARKSKD